MIPRSPDPRQTSSWQQELARAITDPAELLQVLALPGTLLPQAEAAARTFPLKVPASFVRKMRKGDPHDPLLRQILPLGEELQDAPGFVADPVGDGPALKAPGLIHKYRDRALLTVTPVCAVHCRYCFRRHFDYAGAGHGPDTWRAAADYVRTRPEITELILSGGDPLSLSNGRLQRLTDAFRDIAHLKRLRIHTRQPVMLPGRVDTGLLDWLRALPWDRAVVIHANHPAELDDEVAAALAALKSTGVLLLNQSVVLRGVNDDVDVLEALSERLYACGVLPYYLNRLDRVAGSTHFYVSDARVLELHARLRERLPGYLVPRPVREVAGVGSKEPLFLV